MTAPRTLDELTEDERERLRRAHHRLRKASQELEALTVPRQLRGRWEPLPAPAEVLDAVRVELARAYADLWRAQRELLGWEAPPGGDAP